MATAEGELQTRAYNLKLIARKYKNKHIKHQTKIFGNVWEPHTILKCFINESLIKELYLLNN